MPKHPSPAKLAAIEKAGFSVSTWTAAVGLGRSTYYTLPDECRPQSTTIGTRRIITEAPQAWLQRMAARGGVQIAQRAAA